MTYSEDLCEREIHAMEAGHPWQEVARFEVSVSMIERWRLKREADGLVGSRARSRGGGEDRRIDCESRRSTRR